MYTLFNKHISQHNGEHIANAWTKATYLFNTSREGTIFSTYLAYR